MKHFLFNLFLSVSFFTSSVCAQETIDFGRYHALVIGNNDYQHLKDLRTAIADAEAVAVVLAEKYGFRVKLQKNARRRDIINAMNVLTSKLTEKDNLLIYYAGHGILDKLTDTGYWQPVDAEPDSDTFWIPTTDINRRLTRMNAKHVLVIADSCYAGSLLTRGENPELPVGEEPQTWLLRMLQMASRTALTSGYLGPVQDSGSGGHSVFADVLLDTLRDNKKILDGHGLYEKIKRPVTIRAAGTEQIPQYADIKSIKHKGGDFLLVPNELRDMKVSNYKPPDLPDWLFRGGSTPSTAAHCAKPTAPFLAYPSHNGIQPNHWYGKGDPWRFKWLGSSCEGGAIKGYQLLVVAVGAVNPAIDKIVEGTSYTGNTGGTVGARDWTWKVRAIDDRNQMSDWSEERRFYVPKWDIAKLPSPSEASKGAIKKRLTMKPGTGFIFSSQTTTSGVGADRDIWWNGVELVPGKRMCELGPISSVKDENATSADCVLRHGAFKAEAKEGFVIEIQRGSEKQYAIIQVLSVNRNITFEWMYPM